MNCLGADIQYSNIRKIYYKILPRNIRLRADKVLSSIFLFFLEPLYYGSFPSTIEAAIHDLGVLDYKVNVQWAGNYNYNIKFISTYGEGFCLKLKVIKSLLDLTYCKYSDYYLDEKRGCLSTCLKYRWQLALTCNSNVALFFSRIRRLNGVIQSVSTIIHSFSKQMFCWSNAFFKLRMPF